MDQQSDPSEVLAVTRSLAIPLDELSWRFLPSGGPGGQHANRSHTKVEVRFDVAASPSLNDAQRARLLARLGPEVRVVAVTERSQARNRAEALARLADVLRRALHVPRSRVATTPTYGGTQRRLADKQRRSDTKQGRRRVDRDE